MDSLTENPIYACPLPFGVYAMARANAEQGKSYDVAKVVGWAFAGGKVCIEGVHAGRYGDYDLSGLVEMQGCRRMYAMETFLWAKSLVPMVRYDARLRGRSASGWPTRPAARAYFYPGYLPKEHWLAPKYRDLTRGVIGSECLTAKSHYGDRPVPSAETDKWQGILTPEGKPAVWPRAVNFSLYGSSPMSETWAGSLAERATRKFWSWTCSRRIFSTARRIPPSSITTPAGRPVSSPSMSDRKA